MKNLLKSKNLPVFVLGLGGIGLVLRRLLYAVAVDGKNLLLSGQPLELLLWIVTAAAVVLVILGVRKLSGSNEYEANFSASPVGALGAALLAVGILISVLQNGLALSGLEMARDLLGLLAAVAMVCVSLYRRKGQKPSFLLYAVVCVFFAIHMLSCYRGWSSNPQMQDYVFTLFGCIGLMLFAYQQAALCADCGSRRIQLAMGLLGAFACFVCLSGTDSAILYLTGGIWTITNLCSLTPAQTEE